MSFRAYDEYRESGVDWLGQVPTNWEVVPIKSVARVVNGYPFDSKLFDSSDGIPLIRIRDLNKSVAETFYTGERIAAAAITADDVLIGMDGDFNVGRWRGKGEAMLNQRMCCVRGATPLITRLLEYALPFPLKAINDVTFSTTVKHLSSYDVEKTKVALPEDQGELSAIVAFLDHETSKIDALVAEQRRLIELLQEKRQAVISHAVTKGLDPSARMKPSGIQWLGDVPEHWEVGPLKRFWSITDCKHVTAEFVDEGIPLASIREVQSREINLCEAKRTTEHFYQLLTEGGRAPRSGDLVFSRNATVGEIAQVTDDTPRFAMGQDVCLLRKVKGSESTSFWQYMLRSASSVEQMAVLMVGATFKRINVDEIRNLSVVSPPATEQASIVHYLDLQCEAFDRLIGEAEQATSLLQERRTALISAAVTGKIDVREVALQETS